MYEVKCYKCGKLYANKLSLQTHLYRVHNDWKLDIDDPFIPIGSKFNRGGYATDMIIVQLKKGKIQSINTQISI